MFVNVIPVIRSIRGVDSFTYEIQPDLKIQVGSIVWLPWRNHIIFGVVAQLNIPTPKFKTKTITKLTNYTLPQQYFKRLHWIAQYYYISLSHAVRLALPDVPKRQVTTSKPKPIVSTRSIQSISKARLTVLQSTIKTILESHNKPLSIIYTQLVEVLAILHSLLKNTNQRIAIIVPETYQVELLAHSLAKYQPVHVTASLNKTQLFAAWKEMLDQTTRIWIGTKRLSLFPLEQLDSIYLLDPEDSAHKQWDQNPRYAVATMARYIQHHSAAKLVQFSQSPSIEQVQQDTVVTSLVDSLPAPHITVLDLTSEAGQIKYNLLTQRSVEVCSLAKVPFFWFNHKGNGKFLVCKNCGIFFDNLTTTICTKCRSANLIVRGHGTSSLVQVLRELFPERVIIELTKDQTKLQIDYSVNPIIVGTSFAYSQLDWSKVSCTIVVSVDQILAQPYFRASELTLHQLVRLRNLSSELFIQTYAPQHPIFQAIQTYFPKTWYTNELQERKKLQLPPFGDWIELIQRTSQQTKILTHLPTMPLAADCLIDREL